MGGGCRAPASGSVSAMDSIDRELFRSEGEKGLADVNVTVLGAHGSSRNALSLNLHQNKEGVTLGSACTVLSEHGSLGHNFFRLELYSICPKCSKRL